MVGQISDHDWEFFLSLSLLFSSGHKCELDYVSKDALQGGLGNIHSDPTTIDVQANIFARIYVCLILKKC
jgi:hypothetical protein